MVKGSEIKDEREGGNSPREMRCGMIVLQRRGKVRTLF